MYTLEIRGVAVATTDADEAEAREIFLSDEFKEDIASLTADGKLIWDGEAPLTVRAATDEEKELFGDAMVDDEEDEEDEDEGASVMFLVDIDQFDEEDFDEDELDDDEA